MKDRKGKGKALVTCHKDIVNREFPRWNQRQSECARRYSPSSPQQLEYVLVRLPACISYSRLISAHIQPNTRKSSKVRVLDSRHPLQRRRHHLGSNGREERCIPCAEDSCENDRGEGATGEERCSTGCRLKVRDALRIASLIHRLYSSEEEQLCVVVSYYEKGPVMTTNQDQQHQKVHRGGGGEAEALILARFCLPVCSSRRRHLECKCPSWNTVMFYMYLEPGALSQGGILHKSDIAR